MERRYNENITIIDNNGDLGENEYYALMVIDTPGLKDTRDTRRFFDASLGWLGLERTSDKIYISKKKQLRLSVTRGDTVRIQVKDKTKCYELTL